MYRIEQGTTHGLADTAEFIALLGRLRAGASGGERLPDGGRSFDGGSFFADGRELFVTRAPGRLDLMGGIADYSGSLVLELPIAAATHVALQLRREPSLRLVSLRASGGARVFELALAELRGPGGPVSYAEAAARFRRERGDVWASYVAGAFLVLMRERGAEFREGASLLVSSDVPEGKGVSSSAALEVATMQAVCAAYGIETGARELAFLCQKVENLVACAPCGVMDQMTAACGERGRLLALLCQPGEPRGTVRLPEGLEVWGIDSGVRHSVGGADYSTVRTAAFMGYRIIAEAARLPCRKSAAEGLVEIDDAKWGGYLANVGPAEFEERYAALLPERVAGAEFLARYDGITDAVTRVEPAREYRVRQATRHPVQEHARVRRFAEILSGWHDAGGAGESNGRADESRSYADESNVHTKESGERAGESNDHAGELEGRARELGELMHASHESYSACGLGAEGTDELARLVREAGPAAGLYGAKITGGGSGGTVAVLGRRGARGAVERVAREYARRTGRDPLVISGSSPGAAAFGHIKMRDDE